MASSTINAGVNGAKYSSPHRLDSSIMARNKQRICCSVYAAATQRPYQSSVSETGVAGVSGNEKASKRDNAAHIAGCSVMAHHVAARKQQHQRRHHRSFNSAV